ncbi:MAG TPA: acetyl-CoA C-acyltransferase [Polyangiaceae bacterium]|nr:acetyl-CoA C-acyltransferase [Polyangiaceae bacterium]
MTRFESLSNDLFALPAVELVRRERDQLLRSRHALRPYARCSGEFLEYWARCAPEREFVLERNETGWRALSYGEMLDRVRRVGAWLLGTGLSAQRPVAILSENSLEQAVLTLACLHVGVPVAPISPAYSLVSKDFGKLRSILRTLRPGLVYVSDLARFAPALSKVRDVHDGSIVSGERYPGDGVLAFDTLLRARDDAAVERAFEAITADTIAKLMFTSGSTSEPKAVINTQRMLCSNQEAIAQIWPFVNRPPVLLDWLPWHHTFGGNHNFNIVLRNGGTLYIDGGRPLPGEFEQTLSNLREVAPTLSLNVPRAYDLLVSALQRDSELRSRFFSRLELIFYAGAALPQHLWEALRSLARQTLGHDLPLVSSWGLTETAPTATIGHFSPDRAGIIGLPVPGSELKLVPNGDKTEVRVRGPNVTPGYFRREELTANSFDDEGFFRTGDAVRFVDPKHPERGLVFDGRIGEDFKLSTATWVNVGALRLEAISALAPVAQDVVVTGHDRDEIGLLIFPSIAGCRSLCSDLAAEAAPGALFEHPAVRARVAAGLSALARASTGSSTFPRRALVLAEPACADAGEITDKGYINQRAVLTRRAALVDVLYEQPLQAGVITVSPDEVASSGRAQVFRGRSAAPPLESNMYEASDPFALVARYDDIWLLGGVRTPFADYTSILSGVSATDLGIHVARALFQRSDVPARDVGAVIAGNVAQSSFDAFYLPRHIGLYSGVPLGVPALLVHRLCGTGFETILNAADQIALGRVKLALCVGTESMSRNPVSAFTHRTGFKMGQVEFKDFLWEATLDTASNTRMGETAENLARLYGITREEVDSFAAQSFERAVRAWAEGHYRDEVAPVTSQQWPLENYRARGIALPRHVERFERDEHVRASPLEVLRKLRPAFGQDGVQTGGNSSAIVDGAAAALVASGEYVRAHGLKPLARIVAGVVVGVPPEVMGIGPAPAIRALLRQRELNQSDVARFEINEAFGAQYLAVEKELGLDRERVNVHGGAIAIGHPLAASGVRLTVAAARAARRARGEFAIASACAGGGQGVGILLQSAV